MDYILSNLHVVIPCIIVLLILGICASGYVKAPTDRAYIISGFKKEPKVLIGRAGIKIPFLERKDELLLKQVCIDIKTGGTIPTKDYIGVDIDAVAKVRLITYKDINTERGITKAMADAAMRNFLNANEKVIVEALTDSLQGNMREIIGTQTLSQLCQDRKGFGDQVQEKAQKDMNALGVWIESCNIQKLEDKDDLINTLGLENAAQIKKDASIAKAQADRDVAIAQAQADKEANEARVTADKDIARQKQQLTIEQARLKTEADTKQAEADAAYEIQQQAQRKTIEITRAMADIARQEKEVEIKQQEANVKEQELAATIKKQADAEKYRREREAEARLIEQQKQAEAELITRQKEAEGIRLVGEAEAEAIRAKGLAEAEALEKKAEAMKKYGSAAILEMIVNQLPNIAAEVAKPLSTIDKVSIIDSGSGNSGVSNVGGYVPAVMAKTFETVKEATGIDMSEIVRANTYDAQVNKNVTVTGLEMPKPEKKVVKLKKEVPAEASAE